MKIVIPFYVRVLFSGIVLSGFLTACSSENSEPTPVDPVVEMPDDGTNNDVNHIVYATFNEAINDVWVANILTACGPMRLSDGRKGSQATGLAVAENDFYISGNEQNSKGYHFAKYWKNSESILLVDSTSDFSSSAEDITVVNGDVFIAGYLGGQAVFWKNGEVIFLTDEKTIGHALCITVSGNDVYVGGSVKDVNNKYVAAYWVNGNEIRPAGSYVNSIFVKDNNVYLAGSFGTTFKYLKNDSEVSLNEPSRDMGTSSIFVNENDDVYIAAPGRIWHNDEQTKVMVDGKEVGFAFMQVLDNNIYGGITYYNGSHYVAAYWKDGEVINITDGTNNSGVSDIEVVKIP